MPTTFTSFPVAYSNALDEVLVASTYASKYSVPGAEFLTAKQVSVPDLSFGASPAPVAYNRFKSAEGDIKVDRKVYTLAHDDEKVFYIDAVDAINEAAVPITKAISEYQRTILAPEIDKDFFAVAKAKAATKGTTALTAANIKAEIRKARTQFTQAGLHGGDLYMTSAALGLLEDATNRQWSNETSITDTVGSYNGFNVYEVADSILGADFTAISGGNRTMQYITKRAALYLFAPGSHTNGDGWLAQNRWVYGSIVPANKAAGVYTSKKA
ncbi:hypothetical protein Ccur_02740 [Cryptobacterium curtum DSM 15641]|uniref:Uncharacterized protein n=1 Tax=Cryptobacterium curtum (strain ATCC 700683 / DSM 15641 / CCUG 43107 / 12-3) TaxID=469378 RepID=C7MM61_CRYCD|nr:hypothetical protein [Cryptobacterium curtum]ACU94001.1 hypothetical protein Ccur_02740 [Cryptobacterium curtum DSM 15641]